jgi:hypothetical protein
LDGGSPQRATDLITTYGDCIHDKVNCCATCLALNREYWKWLEMALNSIKRGTSKSQDHVLERNCCCFAHCQARDMAFIFMEGEEKREFLSSMRVPSSLSLSCWEGN